MLISAALAPSLYGQVPGLATVQAGALSCSMVLRAADQVQTYCRFGPRLVRNTISDVNTQLVDPYQWCVGPNAKPAGCTYTSITWKFWLLTTPQFGMGYEVTVDGSTITSGQLTAIYGTLGMGCSQIPVPWSGVTSIADGTKVPISIWTRGKEICSTVTYKDAVGYVRDVRCPLTNLFQTCGGVLVPLNVVVQ